VAIRLTAILAALQPPAQSLNALFANRIYAQDATKVILPQLTKPHANLSALIFSAPTASALAFAVVASRHIILTLQAHASSIVS